MKRLGQRLKRLKQYPGQQLQCRSQKQKREQQ
jgi:hypothetical protein